MRTGRIRLSRLTPLSGLARIGPVLRRALAALPGTHGAEHRCAPGQGLKAEAGGPAVAGEVTVDRAAMVTAANQIEDALGQIRGQQARLVSSHETLASSWQGEASGAFTGAFNQFNEDFGIVIKALDAMHQK